MIRREPIYVSTEVWKACFLLAQCQSGKADEQGLTRMVTADEIADSLLRNLISEKYPQISRHRDQIKKLEREFVKELGGGK